MMQDWLVAIHQKLYFFPPRGVASSAAGIGQDIDRQRTGGRPERSLLKPASKMLACSPLFKQAFPLSFSLSEEKGLLKF